MVKAVGLVSGGLDSILALKMVLEQGIDFIALTFITPFCSPNKKEFEQRVRSITKKFSIPIKVISLGEDYIEMIRNPAHGYGKHLNPCIDCRVFMLKKAKQFMKENGASFVFTGEVMDQRPMSQRKAQLQLIEKEADLEGLILRPLSAKLLEPTTPEKEGWVRRESLLSLEGRQRTEQIKLAEKFGIKNYSWPAGGCKLTDPQFAARLKEAFEHGEESMHDIKLLNYGRHFRLPSGTKVVVGRNEEENKVISGLAQENNLLLEVIGFAGPTTLLLPPKDKKDPELAASICVRYSDFDKRGEADVVVKEKGVVRAGPIDPWRLEEFRIS
jgi:tRNA U34 2-thiouridine synthase MnmA/TrmU